MLARSSMRAGEGLLLEGCSAIHSIGMRFAFDAVFLDRNGKVLHLVYAMKPWRVSRVVPGARYCLELPAGTIRVTGTQVGDILTWEA